MIWCGVLCITWYDLIWQSTQTIWNLTYWPQFLTFSKNFFTKIYDWVTPPYQVGVNRIKRNFVRFQILTRGTSFSWKILKFDLLTPIFDLFQKIFRLNLWLGHTLIPSRCEQDQKKVCQISIFYSQTPAASDFMKNHEIWPSDPNFWPFPKKFSPKSMIRSHPHTK